MSVVASGCGDRCERLCVAIDAKLASDECVAAGVPARPAGWVSTCRRDWNNVSDALTRRQLEQALQVCADTRAEMKGWGCEELAELYDTGVP